MWKLTEIKIRNIVSFREAALKITQGVATLIFGKNEDNASQPCNGSGKSSLIEAISFALTGEQLRKVKSIEEIINDSEDEAYVYLALENDYDNTTFTIERTISRNAPQSIECHKYNSLGEEIEVDKTIQPTVLDYNKFILSEIGLSKDDIYNFFILCDNKYESFFDCSDRNKKEIINRFSNGVIIDESVARLQLDMEPVEQDFNNANSQISNVRGSISAIENELAQADEKKANAKQEREARIERLDDKIKQCREDIETNQTKKEKAETRLENLKSIQKEIAKLEESDMSLLEAYKQIKDICEINELGNIGEYDVQLQQYKNQLSGLEKVIDKINEAIAVSRDKVKSCKEAYQTANKIYLTSQESMAQLNSDDADLKEKIKKEIAAIDRKLDEIEVDIKSNKNRQSELEAYISKCTVLLKGAVECPKCSHMFFVNNSQSVDEVKKKLSDYQNQIAAAKTERQKLDEEFDNIDKEAGDKEAEVCKIDGQIKQRNSDLEKQYYEVNKLSKDVDAAEAASNELQKQLTSAESNLDRLNGKIDVMRNRMFGEITGILDGRVMNGENFIKQLISSIEFSQGQMKQYQQSKRELVNAPETDFTESLKNSLKKYQSDLTKAEKDAAAIKSEYDKLKEQEVHFTLFKSHIARKKIDALSLVVNDFLEKIGSDIRLKLEGFTVTKTGKLRDKISVQVMRDGIDCGSYHKFSGGEKARLNLACILALHTLTNSNCEDGKGLDFIIIDELLDKSDEVGMATYCEALNKLGQTALLITQGGVAEGYPHKLLIVKKQGVSTIQN